MYNLSRIYEKYKKPFDSTCLEKSTYYLYSAARFGFPQAQYKLGSQLYQNFFLPNRKNDAIMLLTYAANQNHPKAQYYIGMINLEGIYMPKNINKAIEYLTKSANQNYDESIRLLIQQSKKRYISAIYLICIVLTKVIKTITVTNIKNKLLKFEEDVEQFANKLYDTIKKTNLENTLVYEAYFEYFRDVDYIYDIDYKRIQSSELLNFNNIQKNSKQKKINKLFYDGFGYDI
ncbi:hypothetical protein M9Y10_041899 [Tritrichomonas musculus]|uniref:Sel1-like repeat-containing protein n=1 Tax=Tritrichomonas musculus TaxID=1915356 RepID=A0ABR2K5P5_9EUKA